MDLLALAEFKFIVKELNYGPSKLTATYAGPTLRPEIKFPQGEILSFQRGTIQNNRLPIRYHVDQFLKSFREIHFSPWRNNFAVGNLLNQPINHIFLALSACW